MSSYKVQVIIEQYNDGYIAICPDMHGCKSEAKTLEETIGKIEDLIEEKIASNPNKKHLTTETLDINFVYK